jgi:hypothetical protein
VKLLLVNPHNIQKLNFEISNLFRKSCLIILITFDCIIPFSLVEALSLPLMSNYIKKKKVILLSYRPIFIENLFGILWIFKLSRIGAVILPK